jgi:hydroxyacylglutathione hydrolase
MLTAQGVPAFEDNYTWLIQHAGRPQVVIVDPGDADPVIAAITAQSLEPVAILITHHHWDHTGGIAGLLNQYTMPVYGPACETIPHLSQGLAEGDIVELEAIGASFRVMDVPGHTAGHIAFYFENNEDLGNENGMLFCGDTLFAGGCGRLFEGTPEQMHDSLSRMAALPDHTQVYCAHEYTADNLVFARIAEPDNQALQQRQQKVLQQRSQGLATVPSLLGEEKATNPFLRFNEADIIRSAEGFAGRKLSPGAEVFTVLRHWKDSLD